MELMAMGLIALETFRLPCVRQTSMLYHMRAKHAQPEKPMTLGMTHQEQIQYATQQNARTMKRSSPMNAKVAQPARATQLVMMHPVLTRYAIPSSVR